MGIQGTPINLKTTPLLGAPSVKYVPQKVGMQIGTHPQLQSQNGVAYPLGTKMLLQFTGALTPNAKMAPLDVQNLQTYFRQKGWLPQNYKPTGMYDAPTHQAITQLNLKNPVTPRIVPIQA